MNTVSKRLEDILGDNYFRPYDVHALNLVSEKDEGMEVLKALWDLYTAVDFSFHAPGNSFRRNVLIEVTMQFRLRHDQRLLALLGRNEDHVREYHENLRTLIGMLRQTRTRTMEGAALNLLRDFDYEHDTLEIYSTWHIPEGIEATLRTYANLPADIPGRIRYVRRE
jgi:hypothetical protein